MTRRLRHPGLALAFILIVTAACSSTSGSALPAAARGLSPTTLQASPEMYQGQRVTLGGTIVAMHPRPDGTDIEVVGRPLGDDGRPERGDRTTGTIHHPERRTARPDDLRPGALHHRGRSGGADGVVVGLRRFVISVPGPDVRPAPALAPGHDHGRCLRRSEVLGVAVHFLAGAAALRPARHHVVMTSPAGRSLRAAYLNCVRRRLDRNRICLR